jgi:hypothetical protein
VPLVPSEFNQLRENLYKKDQMDSWKPDITIRVQGNDSRTWKGEIRFLPPSEARDIPPALSSRAGGPVPVKATDVPNQLQPQTQQFLVYLDILKPDDAIFPGCMGQAKIYLRPETCAQWLWRTISDIFDIGLVR